MSPSGPIHGGGNRVRDRRVVLLLLACVVAVLGLDVVSGLVPELDDVLSGAPVLMLALVTGTTAVLVLSVGRGRRA